MKKHPVLFIILVIIGSISTLMALTLVCAVTMGFIGMATEKHTDAFIDNNRASFESIADGYIDRLYDYGEQCKAPVDRLTMEEWVSETGELELTIERRYYKAPNDPVVTKREIIVDEKIPPEDDKLFAQLADLMQKGYGTDLKDVSMVMYIGNDTIKVDFYSRQEQEDCIEIRYETEKQDYETGNTPGRFYYFDKDHTFYQSK